MVLQSIIEDPTCICGAGHVLKPVSRSILRITCVRIGSGYPHDSIPALPPLPLRRLDPFTPPFAAGSSDFREARMWAGPDSRLPTPYFRRQACRRIGRQGCGPGTRPMHHHIIASSEVTVYHRSTTSSRRHGNIIVFSLSISANQYNFNQRADR